VKAINFAGESVLSSSTGIGYRIPSNVPQPPVDLHPLHTRITFALTGQHQILRKYHFWDLLYTDQTLRMDHILCLTL
jgi:hypothetical protein